MPKAAYSRALLKLSGEALMGSAGYGVDPATLAYVAGELAVCHQMNVQLGVVIGGGNIFRGVSASAAHMDRVQADYMGMLATVINAIALADALTSKQVPARVMTAIRMPQIAEPYTRPRAMRHLELGRILILAAGTGNPFFTTDTAAALRAQEIGAQVLLKATKVDGIYDRDPVGDPQARKFQSITYDQVLAQHLQVMDATAISLARDNKLPVIVFDLNRPGNIGRVLAGEPVGSLVEE